MFLVQSWCEKWQLEVNLNKRNILHIRSKRKQRSNFMFIFNKHPIPYCKFYKYLGCYVNEHLDFSFMSEMQADSAGRALSLIITKMIKNGGFPYTVYSLLFKTCVCSISMYGSEVFGFKQHDPLLKLQLRAARAFLGVAKNVTSCGLISELDWLLPQHETRLKMIQHFSRIMNTPTNQLMFKVYRWDRYLNYSKGLINWTSEVKSIFQENNLAHIFNAQEVFPAKNVIAQLKESMNVKQLSAVKIECESKPKLRTFIKFKDFHNLAPHIGKPLSFLERKLISQLRMGVLPLRIETARYMRPIIPENEQFCYCKSGLIETEFHAIFECSMYTDLRQN